MKPSDNTRRVSLLMFLTRRTLNCCVGGHEFTPAGVGNAATEYWIHVEVDGLPICLDHVVLIANETATRGIPESAIKKILIRRDEEARRARAEGKLRRGPGKNAPGWVYYARVGDLIKIGYTMGLAERMAEYPPNTELLAAHPGTRGLESEMHVRFRELRARGREWFHPGPVLEAHINDIRQRFGETDGIVKPMRHAKKGKVARTASRVLP